MSSCFRLLLTASAAAAVAALLSVAMPESAQLSAGDGHGHSAVLITGGGGGIGRAVGEMLEAEGWLVFVTVRKEADVTKLSAEGRLVPIMFDVTNDAHAQPAAERVAAVLRERSRTLDAVIANAGINPEGDKLQEMRAATPPSDGPNQLADVAVAQRVMDTNVIGVWRTVTTFLPLLHESRRGRIMLVGSYFGSIAGNFKLRQVAYETSKFALEGMAAAMRRGFAPQGIGVSLLKPGNIKTAMNPGAEDPPDVLMPAIRHALTSASPRRRYPAGRVKGWPVWLLCWVFEMLPSALGDKLLA